MTFVKNMRQQHHRHKTTHHRHTTYTPHDQSKRKLTRHRSRHKSVPPGIGESGQKEQEVSFVRCDDMIEFLQIETSRRHPEDVETFASELYRLLTKRHEEKMSKSDVRNPFQSLTLTMNDCTDVMTRSTCETYRCGQVIYKEQSTCTNVYVVWNGSVDVTHGESKQIITTVGPANILGETGVLCNKSRVHTTSAFARSSTCTLITMPVLSSFWKSSFVEIKAEMKRIESIPLFRGVSRSYLFRLFRFSHIRRFLCGALVYKQGTLFNNLMIVRSGRVVLSHVTHPADICAATDKSKLYEVIDRSVKVATLSVGEIVSGEVINRAKAQCTATVSRQRGCDSGLTVWCIRKELLSNRFLGQVGIVQKIRRQMRVKAMWRAKRIEKGTRRVLHDEDVKRENEHNKTIAKPERINSRTATTTKRKVLVRQKKRVDVGKVTTTQKRRVRVASTSSHKRRVTNVKFASDVETNIPTNKTETLLMLAIESKHTDALNRQLKRLDDELNCSTAAFRRCLDVMRSGSKALTFASLDAGRLSLHHLSQMAERSPRLVVRPRAPPYGRPTTAPARHTANLARVLRRPAHERKRSVRWFCHEVRKKSSSKSAAHAHVKGTMASVRGSYA